MRHAEHQRRVGIGPDRDPFGIEKLRRIRLERTDHDKTDAGILGALQPRSQHMGAGAPGTDLGVLQCQAAEGDDELGVFDDRSPVGNAAGHGFVSADHMRQQKLRSSPAVIAELIGAAAAEKQEAPRQAPGMVQAPGG